MAKKRIIVLGAGLAGLSAAWHLQKIGIDCLVFEKEPEVGGLCRSKTINGFTFDYSGHLLHFKQAYAFRFIKNLLGGNLARHERKAYVYSFNRYIPYPFQANLHNLPLPILKECLLGFILASQDGNHNKKMNLNFLHWINQAFGKGIARHFMIPYNNKFWTLPLEKMTCEWLDGFIPVPTPGQIVEGAIKESRHKFGYNTTFWYPKKGGIRQIPLALASQVKRCNTGSTITGISLKRKEIEINSGSKERFDYLVSTIPLPEIKYLIKDAPKEVSCLFRSLKWNSIFNLNLGLNTNGDNHLRHWIYFPERNISFFRVGFPHRFSTSLAPDRKSSFYVELAYSKDKPIDKNKITSNIKEDLGKAGLLGKSARILCQDINDIQYGYPIYDLNYDKTRGRILRYLLSKDIIPCGRYGSWRYLSMEGALLEGNRVANIL